MTNKRIPTPTNAELRAAFLTAGLSLDAVANEWIDMQEAVIGVITDAGFTPADDDERDAMYSHADTIVGRIDRAGGLR